MVRLTDVPTGLSLFILDVKQQHSNNIFTFQNVLLCTHRKYFQQYFAGYTDAIFLSYPIRRRVQLWIEYKVLENAFN